MSGDGNELFELTIRAMYLQTRLLHAQNDINELSRQLDSLRRNLEEMAVERPAEPKP